MDLIDQIKYDERGLVTAIIQDYVNNEVLMVAYMNKEAFKRTLESGRTWFWSRSRKKYWQKGEHSGHVQSIKEILIDCDNDAILIKVEQKKAACHAGYRSCFYRKLESQEFKVFQEKIFDEKKVYT
jgi:phosphoribosyl-AMP cyclohydrolase